MHRSSPFFADAILPESPPEVMNLIELNKIPITAAAPAIYDTIMIAVLIIPIIGFWLEFLLAAWSLQKVELAPAPLQF